MSKSLYLIPGLGFDKRIFKKLQLGPHRVSYLPWLQPLDGESISAYAARMAACIPPKEEKICLIGHSFGGILAQEIARLVEVEQVILLSSIKSRRELPLSFRLVGWFRLHRLFSKAFTLRSFPLWAKPFGYESEELKVLFVHMLERNSDRYLRWALQRLSGWDPPPPCKTPVIHLHGDRDKTFPAKLIREPVTIVKDGTHLMVYNRADEVSQQILNFIN